MEDEKNDVTEGKEVKEVNDVKESVTEGNGKEVGTGFQEGIKGLAKKLEEERKQLMEKLQAVEAANQAMGEELAAHESDAKAKAEEYRKNMRELKAMLEKEKTDYEEKKKNYEEELNSNKIELVNKDAEVRKDFEEEIHTLELAKVSLEEELDESVTRGKEEKARLEENLIESKNACKGLTEKLKAKDIEWEDEIMKKEEEIKKMEDGFTSERKTLMDRIHSKDMEINTLKVEDAQIKAKLDSITQRHQRDIEKMKNEVVNYELKELEKRLFEERSKWREKLEKDTNTDK